MTEESDLGTATTAGVGRCRSDGDRARLGWMRADGQWVQHAANHGFVLGDSDAGGINHTNGPADINGHPRPCCGGRW